MGGSHRRPVATVKITILPCQWCGQSPAYHPNASRWVCSDACNALLTSTAIGAGILGIPVRTYRSRVKDGLKWCPGHQDWHPRTEAYFYARRAKLDGLDTICKEINRVRAREGMRRLSARRRAARQEAS